MQTLPHAKRSEQAVLGAVLLRPVLFEDLDLSAEDFYLERHQLIYRAFSSLSRDNHPIDIVTVEARLLEMGKLETAGGMAYLTGLDLVLPDLSQIGVYAGFVRDYARRRELIMLGHRLAARAGEGAEDVDVDALAARFRRRLEDLEAGIASNAGVWASDVVGPVLEDAAARRAQREETGEAVFGLRTGIPRLDQLLCGLNRGLYLLAGSPGVGKTSLAMQIALHVARETPVVFVTFENSAASLVLKTLCASAAIKTIDVSRGFVDPAPLSTAADELAEALGRLQLVEGDGSFTVGRLRALVRRALEQRGDEGSCLVVIDYLQLWSKVSQELRTLSDARAKVDALGGELIALARRLDSPVLALSSQSRAGGNYGRGGGRASLDSLKESGDLEYSADVALFLTPEEDDQAEQGQPVRALELAIKKNRHGPVGVVPMTFMADRGSFRETDTKR